MTHKTLIYIFGGLIIVLGGILGMTYLTDTTSTPDVNNETTEQTEETSTEATTTSLRSLMEGESVVCNFTQPLGEEGLGTVDGTIYVANNRVRGEFVTKANEESFATSIIYVDETTYVWGNTPFGTQAFIIKNVEQGEQENGVDFDQELPYACTHWEVDNAQFVPPTDTIDFQELAPEAQ